MREPTRTARAAVARPGLALVRLLTLVVLVLGAASLLGLAALVGAATVGDSPVFFLGAGLATFVVTAAAAAELVARRSRAASRARVRVVCAAGAGLGVVAFVLTALVPHRETRVPSAPLPGLRTWQLSTGSSIRYVNVSAVDRRRPDPVVFLHGGPGVPDLAGDSRYFGQLADDGFDVYVYAQVGSGPSSRLADPRGTVESARLEPAVGSALFLPKRRVLQRFQ